MNNKETYKWNYCSIGGVTRVKVESGEDLAHLGELDQKLWTVLSCPVKGLNMDPRTLAYLDTDGDGKIKVNEVVAAADWLCKSIRTRDNILKGNDSINLDHLDRSSESGEKLYDSALHIIRNLGKKKDWISIADTSDSVAIFKGTKFNGDGIITPESTDDADLKALISTIIEKIGSCVDRSGDAGVNAEQIENFYKECEAYAAWQKAGEPSVFPYGDNTAAALDAVNALKDKVADYFMRCKLIRFDGDVSNAVDISVDRIGAISGQNLATQQEEISSCPLARPTAECVLPFDAVNPAWSAAFAAVKTLVLDVDFPKAKGITEEQWLGVIAKFGAYEAWLAAKAGVAVESLGLPAVQAVLDGGKKAELLALVDQDAALAEESAGIDEVDKLLHLYRDFSKLLNNYVIFSEFYDRENGGAAFEAGKLYIDQRCCDLCIKVENMGAHADMAGLSGMFLIYCSCTSKVKAATMDIVAVMTAGGVKNLRPGTNAIFYDRDGQDWDAVVTKIVDNPISVRQAFWSPYRKLANFISDKIDKSASEKDSAATADLLAKADTADPTKAKQPFDIAKFAGIFAAVGMAFAGIGVALKALVSGIVAMKWWQLILALVAIMLVISGPACFIAWRKLRKRNLGPVLNANGWAINSVVLVNILFGAALTSTAKYPHLKLADPYKKVVPAWRKALRWFLLALVVAAAVLFFTDNLGWMGIHRHKEAAPEQVEAVVEAVEPAEAPADTAVVEAAPAETLAE